MSLEVLTGEIVDPLSDAEYDELEKLETVISKGMGTFLEVGAALAEIKDRRLYRQFHSSFDSYCRDQWDMGKSKAYALIHAASIVEELSGIPDTPLPTNSAQADALAPVADDPELAAEVMRDASEDGPATAKKIADQVKKRTAPPDPEPDPDHEMDARQKKAADSAHALADRLSQYEIVHERTIRLMEARCKRWRNQ